MRDLIFSGQGSGLIANRLMNAGWDVDCLRPFIAEDGRHYVTKTITTNGKPVQKAVPLANATATLRRDEWILFDEALHELAMGETSVIDDLHTYGNVLTLTNGMAHTMIQSQNVSDINPATISMDGRRKGEQDRPVYDSINIPLPICHKDFSFSAREIETSRNRGVPLDTSMIKLAGQKVREEVEQLALGIAPTYSYGGGTLYGFKNFPSRLTKVITAPTTSGWTPDVFVNEIIAMKQLSVDHFHRGPWVLYLGTGWGSYLDTDYSAVKGESTLMDRIAKIDRIKAVRRPDFLTGYSALLVQMTPFVCQLIDGLPLTIIQWEEEGGMNLLWKILTIQVIRLRADQNGNTGIVDGEV